jgi:hypothetical protein
MISEQPRTGGKPVPCASRCLARGWNAHRHERIQARIEAIYTLQAVLQQLRGRQGDSSRQRRPGEIEVRHGALSCVEHPQPNSFDPNSIYLLGIFVPPNGAMARY